MTGSTGTDRSTGTLNKVDLVRGFLLNQILYGKDKMHLVSSTAKALGFLVIEGHRKEGLLFLRYASKIESRTSKKRSGRVFATFSLDSKFISHMQAMKANYKKDIYLAVLAIPLDNIGEKLKENEVKWDKLRWYGAILNEDELRQCIDLLMYGEDATLTLEYRPGHRPPVFIYGPLNRERAALRPKRTRLGKSIDQW